MKSARQHLYHFYWSLQRRLSWENLLLVIYKILKLFVKILTAHEKYSLLSRDNLTEPIHMQWAKKENNFSKFFAAFLKSKLNFENFQKKEMALIAYVFPKLQSVKGVAREESKKPHFRGRFDKLHDKRSQGLMKSKDLHLYHIYWSLEGN